MDISVIIPSYKPGTYIWECLSSLVAQTLSKKKFEVIIILNGCNAPYCEQIEHYIKEHDADNFIIYQTDTSGVSNARNIGIDNSQGEYIAFIDDDDFVSPSYLEELLSVSSHDTIGISNEMRYDEINRSISKETFSLEFDKKSPKGKQPYPGIRKFFSGPCMKLLHRDVIASYRFDTRFTNGEDSLFMFAISANMKYVDFTSSDAIYYRRVRSGSAMSKESHLKTMIANRIRLIFAFIDIYRKSPQKYSLRFLFSRIMGCLHSICNSFRAMFHS